MTTSNLKCIAGSFTVAGLIFALFEKLNEPNATVGEDSTILPEWVGWIGFGVLAAASLIYIAIDVFGSKGVEK